MEEPNNYDNFDEKYRLSIKADIESGNYFKDAYNWYCISFLKSITDKTFFIFMSIMGVLIIVFVLQMLSYVFPLKEDIYITIKENDLTKYRTDIVDLAKYKEATSTDEQILEYLLKNYVKERESHNYKAGDINVINNKLRVIKNNSTDDVYNEFRTFMSSANKNGPYYFFGKSIETKININRFKFIRVIKKGFVNKVKDFFTIKALLPIKAEVFYTLITDNGEKVINEKRKAVITFKFYGVEYDRQKNVYSNVKFIVTSYKNYIVK